MSKGVLSKPGISSISMALGWFLHCLMIDVRTKAPDWVTVHHLGALVAVMVLGAILDRNGS
jgi:hypothetical protein